MQLLPKKISIYITKDIFKKFLVLFFSLFILIFTIDVFEKSDNIIDSGFFVVFKYVLFRIPNFLEIALPFILLIASLMSFYTLSNNSEITVMRMSGVSIFKIVQLPIVCSFLLGIFVMFFYNPISSKLVQESNFILNVNIKNNKQDLITFRNGLWMKQENLENGGSIIIKMGSVYKDSFTFNDVISIYIDENNIFTKGANIKTLKFNGDNWLATDSYVFQENKKGEFVKNFSFKTKFTKDFLQKTITSEYDYIYNIPFNELENVIKSLEESGFQTSKFKIRYYSFLVLPFLFPTMILISAYFGIIHYRDNYKYISLLYGIGFGYIIFILNQIVIEIANANKLTIFDSNIFLVLIFIVVSLILFLKKEILSNL